MKDDCFMLAKGKKQNIPSTNNYYTDDIAFLANTLAQA